MIFASYLYLVARIDRRKAQRFCPELSGVVLDVGCGTQPYRQYLPPQTTYVGLEADDRLSPDVVGDVLALPIRSGVADSAMCTMVLEHVSEPGAALVEINRALRPGGRLYVTIPQSWGLHYQPYDFYRYTPYGIAHLLEKNGFRVDRTEQMGGLFSHFCVRLLDLLVDRVLFAACDRVGLHRGRYRLAALLCLPANLVLAPLTDALDRFDPLNAYGWAVLATKVEDRGEDAGGEQDAAPRPAPAALRRPELASFLACPACRGTLTEDDRAGSAGGVSCEACGRTFAVANGVPLLLEARD